MSFSRPSLGDIITRVRADMLSRLAADDALRRADAEVYAAVIGAVSHGLYSFIDYLSRQIIFDTAEAEFLERWALLWNVKRVPAAAATGAATFTAATGSVIAAGTLLQALDGTTYQVNAEATVVTSPLTLAITAATAGAAGNRSAGQTLTLVSPIAGVQPSATVVSLSGGAAIETDDALRARLLARIQSPPQGGSAADYKAWALEVPGVTRAWVSPLELGPGTVTVRFVRDNDGSGAAIIPDASEVAAVQAHIDALRPVTAQLTVVAPVAVPLNFTIQALTPNTSAVQAAVLEELRDLLRREAAPGGTLLLSHIRAAISMAAGETDYVLTSPTSNVTNTTGNMSTMGTVTWL